MMSPKSGFVGIANRIWDEVIRRNFTKRQKDILLFLWRLSYGCQQDVAIVSKQKYFAVCGVGEGHIGQELKILSECKVISRNGSEYRFNEDCHLWQVSPVRGWDEEIFKAILHDNIESSKRRKLTNSVSSEDEGTYQNGKHPEETDLPKREESKANEVTEMVSGQTDESKDVTYQSSKIPSDENLPIREVIESEKLTETVSSTSTDSKGTYQKGKSELTEKVSPTPEKSSRGAASKRSKDSIKDSKDIKYIVEIVNYLNEKAGKNFSPDTKNTIKLIKGRLAEKRTLDDFKYVIDVKVAEWAGDPKMGKYLRPDTLFTQSHFESYRNQPFPTKQVNPRNSRAQNNKALLQQKMSEALNESSGNHSNPFPNFNGLPDGRND